MVNEAFFYDLCKKKEENFLKNIFYCKGFSVRMVVTSGGKWRDTHRKWGMMNVQR